jgi:hypothetical protein
MKSLLMECPECDGCGYVTIDLNDTIIPYEQREVDYTCMSCDGKQYVLSPDAVEDRMMCIEDMIQGMQSRIELVGRSAYSAKKVNNDRYVNKYLDRIDTLTRGLYRLKAYRKNLLSYAGN